MKLTGATDVVALNGLAQECDVAIRMELTQIEARKVALVSDAIIRAFVNEGQGGA